MTHIHILSGHPAPAPLAQFPFAAAVQPARHSFLTSHQLSRQRRTLGSAQHRAQSGRRVAVQAACQPLPVSAPLHFSRSVRCRSSKADSTSKDDAASDASTAVPAAAGAELEDTQHAGGHSAPAEDASSDDELPIRHAADSRDAHEWQQDADADEEGDEGSEDEDENEDGLDAGAVMTDADAKMEEVLREETLSAAVLELAASMFAVGLQGSAALGLGYLILNRSLFDSFRWSLADVETGLLFALPVVALSAAITALPLPTHKQTMNRVMAAAAAAAAAGGGSSSVGGDKSRSFDAFSDARRMATHAAVVSEIPVRVVARGQDIGTDVRLLTRLSVDTATQALRYMQEFVAEPWSTKTYSLESWGVRAVGGLLRRLSVELFWRGLVVAGLAGWLYSSWETGGTNQDSPLFYARLFGLLTPQAALGVIAAILAAIRIPADLSRTQPAVTYTRLASMEVEVVGRLTEEDWLVMVLPAEVAAAAAAAAEATGNAPRNLTAASDFGLGVQHALCEKVQPFGRMKAAQAAGSSSSKQAAAGKQQQQQLSKQEMEQQLDKLLAEIQDWKRRYSSLTGSSSSSSSSGITGAASAAASIPGGFELTPREKEAAELAAAFLELVKASAAAKAAAATATKSKYIAKSAGLPSAKLGSGLETLLSALNGDAQRRLFLLHVGGPDGSSGFDSRRGGSSGSTGGTSDSSSDEEEESSDEDEDESAPGSVQAMMRAKARTAAAAEGTRKEGSAAAGSRQAGAAAAGKGDDTSSGAAPRQLGRLDETLESLREALEGSGDKGKQDEGGSAPSSSGSSSRQSAGQGEAAGDDDSSSDSDSDSDESGLTFSELEGLLKKQMQALSTREGQNSDLALYLKACKGAYRVAASIPTAQDRVANALLLCFALLEQWAVAGAFVASSGNLAASFTAAAALQVVTTTLQQAVGQRERQRLRRDIGSGWALQLQMFGPAP